MMKGVVNNLANFSLVIFDVVIYTNGFSGYLGGGSFCFWFAAVMVIVLFIFVLILLMRAYNIYRRSTIIQLSNVAGVVIIRISDSSANFSLSNTILTLNRFLYIYRSYSWRVDIVIFAGFNPIFCNINRLLRNNLPITPPPIIPILIFYKSILFFVFDKLLFILFAFYKDIRDRVLIESRCR